MEHQAASPSVSLYPVDRQSNLLTSPHRPLRLFAAEAVHSAGVRGGAAIIKINTDFLNKESFLPDEFVLAHAVADLSGEGFEQSYARASILMTSCNQGWRDSLDQMGTCAYQGVVPPAPISRVSYIDFAKMSTLQELDVLDVGMSVTAYQVMSKKYKMIEDWFFGGEVTFGCGMAPEKKLRKIPAFEKRRMQFNMVWSDRSMVRIEECLSR